MLSNNFRMGFPFTFHSTLIIKKSNIYLSNCQFLFNEIYKSKKFQSERCLNNQDHFPPFALGAAFFWAFWAALSWAFWAVCFSLLTVFLSPCLLAIWAFFLSLIYLIASSAKAFLSSVFAFLSLLIVSRVTPSIALFSSCLSFLFLLIFPVSVCLIFLWSLLQAVAHLNLWAFNFLNINFCTSSQNF